MIPAKTILSELKKFVKNYDTNAAAAAALKVTPAQLSSTLNGKVNVIPEKILKKLGYKSQLVYLPLKPQAPKNAPAKEAPRKATPQEVAAADAAHNQKIADKARERVTHAQPETPVISESFPPQDEMQGLHIDIRSQD